MTAPATASFTAAEHAAEHRKCKEERVEKQEGRRRPLLFHENEQPDEKDNEEGKTAEHTAKEPLLSAHASGGKAAEERSDESDGIRNGRNESGRRQRLCR